MNINEPKVPGSQWTRLDAAQQAVERLEQQVAQLREEVAEQIHEREHYYQAWMSRTEEFESMQAERDALQTAHTTLRGLVEEREYEIKRRIWQMHGARMGHQLYGDDGRLDCNTCFRKYSDESIETVYGFELYDANILCAKAATLPREGGVQS